MSWEMKDKRKDKRKENKWGCFGRFTTLESRQRNFEWLCGLWRKQLQPLWSTCGGDRNWGPDTEILENTVDEMSKFKIGTTNDREIENEEEIESIGDNDDVDEKEREEYANLLIQYD